jgi:hypothetical protein
MEEIGISGRPFHFPDLVIIHEKISSPIPILFRLRRAIPSACDSARQPEQD